MAVTLKDVAREAGVSTCTASRVLNNNYVTPIREETKRRVIEAAKKLNYRPNILARGLALKRSSLIGLVVPVVNNSFFDELIQGVENEALERGYTIILYTTRGQEDKDLECITLLRDKSVDGIIWMPSSEHHDKQVVAELVEQVPVVQINSVLPGLETSYVMADHEAGGYLATRHLIELGHRRIAHLGAPYHTDGQERIAGYKRALGESGIEVDEQLIIKTGYSWEAGYAVTKELLNAEPPTAIFACSDYVAWGAMRAIHDSGLTVPGDIAVVGFDDSDIAARIEVPLTTVAQPKQAVGQTALQALHRQVMEGERTVQKLPVKLVVRKSCGAPQRS